MSEQSFDEGQALNAEIRGARATLDRATETPGDGAVRDEVARLDRVAGYFEASRGESDPRTRELRDLSRRAANAVSIETGAPLRLTDAEVAELAQEKYEELRTAGRIG
jgi:hypothetical protein